MAVIFSSNDRALQIETCEENQIYYGSLLELFDGSSLKNMGQ